MHTIAIASTLNEKLAQIKNEQKPVFVLMTGASGVGKTTITTLLERVIDPSFVKVVYFDRIGVPSEQEMIARYGSGKQWQEAKTREWIKKLSIEANNKPLIIFEGQYDPDFALAACEEYNIHNFLLICVYAQQTTREARLIYERKQPELANQDMQNWSELLKNKVVRLGGEVIDTTAITPEKAAENLIALLLKKLGS